MNFTSRFYIFAVLLLLVVIVAEVNSAYGRRRQVVRRRRYHYRRCQSPNIRRTRRTRRISIETETERVRRMYEYARMVTPDLFAITRAQANSFTDGMLREEIVNPPYDTCNLHPVSKYTTCKALELKDIMQSRTCDNETTPNPQDFVHHHRVKRMTTITNSDGSITTVRLCRPRKSDTVNQNLRLCNVCVATTVLPQNVFPRYLNEVLCDKDTKCLSNQGRCYQNYVFLEFRRDEGELGLQGLGNWSKYQQKIRTCCGCQALKGRLFANFV